MSLGLSIALRCPFLRCFSRTPFASSAFDFIRFSEMSSNPSRSYLHSVAVPSFDGRGTVLPSMKEAAFVPSTGG